LLLLYFLAAMSSSRINDESETHITASESTPLLGDGHGNGGYGAPSGLERGSSGSAEHPSKSRRHWATPVALALLCVFMGLIMFLGFFVPESIKSYAVQATTVDIHEVKPEFTSSGVKVRVKAMFSLQSSKVENVHVRNLGILGTWIAREVETSESQLQVTLPEYGNVLVGTAILPPLKVSIVDGSETFLDFLADLIPPKSIDGIREPLDNWITGTLDHLNVAGAAEVSIKSGIIKIASTAISQVMTLSSKFALCFNTKMLICRL
jgi:hypothetical protein